MLQRQQPVNTLLAEEDAGAPLTPAYLFYVLKRRAFSFLIPFVLLSCVGILIALAWPARYLSEGKVLILSPEIPPDLVQPTVISAASERIKIIEQRTLTRDNLLVIAKKFNLSSGWRELVSGTEIIDFIRQRTKIAPLDVRSGGREQVIAFTVGFEYEEPVVATKVANEFLTMILNEDVRSRTRFASETTRFLARDVERIEDQLGLLDNQIIDIQKRRAEDGNDLDQPNAERQLAGLKAELAVKTASLSSSHPDIIRLKRAIAGLEQSATSRLSKASATGNTPDAGSGATATSTVGGGAANLDTLITRRESLKAQLTRATQKLAAARLGETLERDRHSARLEVLEQPTVPDKPVSPNRPKIFAFAFLLAFMAGGGLVFTREMLDQSVRSGQDIASIVDSHLIVPIPYISTQREIRQKKRNLIIMVAAAVVLIIGAGIAAYLFLPPPDVWFDKATDKLMKLLLK
jgi:uncharacterized protein involved in exopolysaccharide biosynthesis